MFLKQIFCLGGVYDSPFATDYFVRQYGFMFGGGRSGLMGLKAMQVNKLLGLNHKKKSRFCEKPRFRVVLDN